MFGYHDSDRCLFDLWSPVDDTIHHSFSGPGFPHATENRAFSPYAKHTQEIEDIIDMIVDRYNCGDMNFDIDLDDDLSQDDLDYISEKVKERVWK